LLLAGDTVEPPRERPMPPLDPAGERAAVGLERGLDGQALALEPHEAAGAMAS
jgi:hypothetical protein